MNYLGIAFCLLWLIGLPVYMVVMLIVEHVREKRRRRRLHQPIKNWWEYRIK